ncbi:molecular chaperone [Pseudomonas protegens]|uniref:fimbrial biogenesis chaperone n=1 Tax=Pseudomonas protegens TaxID=380021 RepID=UPI000F4CDEC3|nr:fimbria/pilus periplasmic chaperone [Pseudomonas protegens]
MLYQSKLHRFLWLPLAILCCSQAIAGVVITGTRQIYPAQQREITVRLNNDGVLPALVHSWVDTGDGDSSPTNAKAPFVVSPPVARIDAGKGQSLRLMFVGAPLSSSKESVFWLNVLEIPPRPEVAADSTVLQMAFRSRIKVFYRPKDLPGDPVQAIEAVQWRVEAGSNGSGFVLRATNPSAYHVSLIGLSLHTGALRVPSEDGMIGPGESRLFALPTLKRAPEADAQVEFSAINDYGALMVTKRPIQH